MTNVFVLIIGQDGQSNMDVWVHATEESAIDRAYDYVKAWWHTEMLGEPMPTNRERAISDYFDKTKDDGEWMLIRKRNVLGAEVAA